MRVPRWVLGLLAIAAVTTYAKSAVAADEMQVSNYVPWFPPSQAPMINGPKCLGMRNGNGGCGPDEHRSFLEALEYWRKARRIYTGYDGSRYDVVAGCLTRYRRKSSKPL